MKKIAILGVFALAVGLVPAGQVSAQTDQSFTFTGSGWGHGVGMSQYGARAMAREGRSAEQILTTYYNGVTVERIDQVFDASHWLRADPAPLWIGIAQKQTVLKFHVHQGTANLCNPTAGPCPAHIASTGESWEFRALSGGVCQFFQGNAPVGNPGSCHGQISWGNQPQTRLHLDDHGEYGRGTMQIRPAPGGFHVVLEIGIDQYLYGLGEMPSDWADEALQAQAIAGRTYGLRQALKYGPESTLSSSRRDQCWCQLYDSTVDQAYVGWLKENDAVDANWVEAVDDTSGILVTHPQAPESTVIIAYYSSSSGGHTDNNVDGFGHSTQFPYLVGIDDPWSVSPLAENPHASWERTFTSSEVATAVGLDSVTGIAITERNSSGSVAEVVISGTLGGAQTSITRSGRSVKSALSLRSLFYSVGNPPGAVVPVPGDDLCESPTPPDAGFQDVGANSVHKGDIDCVAYLGVIQGMSPGLFDPLGEIPRRDMALFMARAAEMMGVTLPPPSDQGFTDLDGLTQEERDAVNQLAMVGVTKGTSSTAYSPERTVDRWQMAIFLIRLHGLVGFDVVATSAGFTDLGSHPQETVRAIDELFAIGVTKGCGLSPARYCPDREVTREQMASFLARLIRIDT
jgi:SpoIID/LytB domain protein